ncbi:MAG: GNAT family N-acetyltransferase [Deltaproteobacteria bacterium]|nr:GNAT family N-acetyltransferase [Deltaproteobacteria bacterium]
MRGGAGRGLSLRPATLAEAPAGAPPATFVWTYAGLFGRPAAYQVLDGDRPVAWICGVGGAVRGHGFEALPERFYGLLPDEGATLDLDALRAALARSGVTSRVQCAPGGDYRAADLSAFHRLDTYLVAAASPDQAYQGMARVGRQGVRKAERSGVTVARRPLAAALAAFHALHAAKCERHGSPVMPETLFGRIADAFGERAEVFLAEHGGRPVAAALVVREGAYAIFADGSSLAEAWRVCPNNLTVWTAARSCLERGARLLDYGITLPGDAGGHRFKAHLGGVRTPVYEVTT